MIGKPANSKSGPNGTGWCLKGSQVYVEGKLQTRKWQDQNGQDRYTTEVLVDSFNGVMQMLGGAIIRMAILCPPQSTRA